MRYLDISICQQYGLAVTLEEDFLTDRPNKKRHSRGGLNVSPAVPDLHRI